MRHHRAEVRAEKLQSRRLGQPAEILVLPIHSRRDRDGEHDTSISTKQPYLADAVDDQHQSHILEALEKERKPLLKEELDANINSIRNDLLLHDESANIDSFRKAQQSLVKGFTLQQLKGYVSRHMRSSNGGRADVRHRFKKLYSTSPKDRTAAQIIHDIWGIEPEAEDEVLEDGSYQHSSTYNPRKLDLMLIEDPHLLNNLSQSFGVAIDVFESDKKIVFTGSRLQIVDASNAFNEVLNHKLLHKPVLLPASVKRHLSRISPVSSQDLPSHIAKSDTLNNQLLALRGLMQSHRVFVDAAMPGQAWSFSSESLRAFITDIRDVFPGIRQPAVPAEEPEDALDPPISNDQDLIERTHDAPSEELQDDAAEPEVPQTSMKGVTNTISGCISSVSFKDTVRQLHFLPGANRLVMTEWYRFLAKSPRSLSNSTFSTGPDTVEQIERKLVDSLSSNIPTQSAVQSIAGVYTEYTAELGHAVFRLKPRQNSSNLVILHSIPFLPQYLHAQNPLPDSDYMSLSSMAKDMRLIRLRFKGPPEVVQPPLEVLMTISSTLQIAVESIRFEVAKSSCYLLLPDHYTDLRFIRRDKLSAFTKGKPILDTHRPVLADFSAYLEASVQTGREDFYHKTFYVNVDMSSLGHEAGGRTRMEYQLDRVEELDIKRYSVSSPAPNPAGTMHVSSNLILDHSSHARRGYTNKQWQQSLKLIDADPDRTTRPGILDNSTTDNNDKEQSRSSTGRLTNLVFTSFDTAQNLDRFIKQKEKDVLAARSESRVDNEETTID